MQSISAYYRHLSNRILSASVHMPALAKRHASACVGSISAKFNLPSEWSFNLPQVKISDVSGVQVAWVPGSFELPVVAKAMAKSNQYGAVVAIGVIVSPIKPPALLYIFDPAEP